MPEYKLTDADWQEIHRLAETRYRNWEWVYGRSPKFNVRHRHRFNAGHVDFRLEVHKGKIEDVSIYGDFFGVGEIEDIEDILTGVKYDQDAIIAALKNIDISHYFGRIDKAEFLKMLF